MADPEGLHATTNSINNSIIHSVNSHHKDLGIVVSDDLQWHLQHKYILDKSYKMPLAWCDQASI